MKKALFPLGLALLISASPAPALAQSQLSSPSVEGYVVAYEASNATQAIEERIPVGETLSDWTSMITTQRFAGPPLTAFEMARAMRDGMVRTCEGEVSQSEPQRLEHQGLNAASYSATCHQSGGADDAETFYMLAIQTPDALFVKQVAFRDVATQANARWAVTILRSVRVCLEDCAASNN